MTVKKMIGFLSTIGMLLISPYIVAADLFQTGETLSADKLNALVQRIQALEKTYAIGDTGPAGGIVFYVTALGHHGLEAAPTDQAVPSSPGAQWGCIGTDIPGADSTAIGTGKQNTTDILAGCATAGIAARLADDFTLNGYDDWFLPSKDELNELFVNRLVVGGFPSDPILFFYWSSSERDANAVECISDKCDDVVNQGKNENAGVRAVRVF